MKENRQMGVSGGERDRPLNKTDPFLLAFGVYGAIGFQLAGTVVGGLLLGSWLDKKWNTAPWLTIVGILIGSIGGFYNLIRLLNWNQQRKSSASGGKEDS